MRRATSTALAAIGLALAAPVSADPIAEFYRGKTVSIYVAAGEGGSYGPYARRIADVMLRHIPGNPAVIARFMPGAGGALAANYVFNAALKDGTAIGLLIKYVAYDQAIGQEGVKYDVRMFQWLGSAGPINSVLAIMSNAPATTLAAARNIEVILGSTGKNSETYITPTLLNALYDTKFKIVLGYKGMETIHLAMDQGEVHGRAASWESIKAERMNWVNEKRIAILAQSGLEKTADLPGVPLLTELAKTAAEHAMYEFLSVGSTIGRVFAAPPGVPAERVGALGRALEASVGDPAFRERAKTYGLDVHFRPGAEIEALIARTVEAPPAIVDATRQVMK